jgi:Zinc-binding dehydrogenase
LRVPRTLFTVVRVQGHSKLWAIDYTLRSDFAGEGLYHVVLDCIMSAPWQAFEAVLAPQGVYLATLPTHGLMLRALLYGRVKIVMLKPKGEDLEYPSRLVEAGHLRTHIVVSLFRRK